MKRYLGIYDPHHPFVDKRGWKVWLKVAAMGWDEIIIGGDFADFFNASFHPKEASRKFRLADEIVEVNKALDQLQKAAHQGGCDTITYLAGNHEHRLNRYINEKASELVGVPGVSVQEVFQLSARGIDYIPYKRAAYKTGKVAWLHDIGRAGKNVASQSLSDYGSSIIVGHAHRLQTYYQGTVRGKSHVGLCAGWLGDSTAADYLHTDKARRDWQLGFPVAYVEDNGNAHVQAVPIIDYKCVVDGKLVKL